MTPPLGTKITRYLLFGKGFSEFKFFFLEGLTISELHELMVIVTVTGLISD
jgi:hypothetical protein